jgi:hypothetical protein
MGMGAKLSCDGVNWVNYTIFQSLQAVVIPEGMYNAWTLEQAFDEIN